jgi:hypothetical protein
MIFPKPFVTIGNQIIYTHLTPDEQEDRERARLEKKYVGEVRKQQRKEVQYLGRAIPNWLAKMGYAYWYKKSEKDITKGHFNPVKIAKAQIGPDAYYFKINTRRMPRKVFISDLRDDRTIETLTAACESTVKFYQLPSGCWYSVDTQYGRGSIPMLVGYAEMLKMMDPAAPPLAWPMGMGENQRPFLGDMDKYINLLIGGTKGGGKSNAANSMLCTFLPRNSPVNLRVFLTDLKGGIEFADYNGIPHLGGDVRYIDLGGEKKKTYRFKTVPNTYKPKENEELLPPLGGKILTEPYEVLPMLAYVEAELDRRARLLAGRAKKLSTYNRRYPDKKMSVWLVVIDELATLMEDARYKKQAVLSLAEIARKGRAVGIYTIMATQTPTSDIVPAQISNNMDARLAFRTGTGPSSGVLLGSGEYDAEKLPAIPGRFIFKWGGDKIQMQAPLIADGTIKKAIAQLRAGKYIDARQVELAQKAEHLFRFSLGYLRGECQTNRLYQMLKPDGFKQKEVRAILEQYEVDKNGQPEIIIDDVIYYLAPPIQARRIARWLVPAAEFIAGKHPNLNYDFSLVSRLSFVENPKKQITAESEKSNGQNGQKPDEQNKQIDILSTETEQAGRANGRQTDGPKPGAVPEPILQNEEASQVGKVPAWLDEFD